MAKVEVELAHHYGKHVPGDKVKVDEDEARGLVEGGMASYSTQEDAKKAQGQA